MLVGSLELIFTKYCLPGIDTDKHKYPIGSGRVTFSSSRSYMKAVAASFVEIKCPQFNKRVQVDPYLEDALCSSCLLKQGPYFCRFVVFSRLSSIFPSYFPSQRPGLLQVLLPSLLGGSALWGESPSQTTDEKHEDWRRPRHQANHLPHPPLDLSLVRACFMSARVL